MIDHFFQRRLFLEKNFSTAADNQNHNSQQKICKKITLKHTNWPELRKINRPYNACKSVHVFVHMIIRTVLIILQLIIL